MHTFKHKTDGKMVVLLLIADQPRWRGKCQATVLYAAGATEAYRVFCVGNPS